MVWNVYAPYRAHTLFFRHSYSLDYTLHPLVAMYHVFHAGLAPTPGHTGYEKMTFKNGVTIPTGDYMLVIHRKYFECNYSGGNTSFLDKLMGTFHDGSEESTKEVMARIKDKAHYL